jgi:hypothetical protein
MTVKTMVRACCETFSWTCNSHALCRYREEAPAPTLFADNGVAEAEARGEREKKQDGERDGSN